jgi:hypothetical protein
LMQFSTNNAIHTDIFPSAGYITRSRVPVALPLVEGIRAQPKLDKGHSTSQQTPDLLLFHSIVP